MSEKRFRLYNQEGIVKISFPSDMAREDRTYHSFYEDDEVRIGHIGCIVHCEDGPAVIVKNLLLEDGSFSHEWVIDGKRHKLGAPAIVRPQAESWWEYGFRHRYDGPAVINPREENSIQWWVRGKEIKNIHELLAQHELNPDEFKSWTDADRLLVHFLIASS